MRVAHYRAILAHAWVNQRIFMAVDQQLGRLPTDLNRLRKLSGICRSTPIIGSGRPCDRMWENHHRREGKASFALCLHRITPSAQMTISATIAIARARLNALFFREA